MAVAPASPNQRVPCLSATIPQITPNKAEEKDATVAQKRLQEINTSTYCYEPSQLIQALSQIKPENNQGEFYLTDTIEILRNQGYHIADAKSERPEEILGVNTQDQLAKVESIILNRGFSSP